MVSPRACANFACTDWYAEFFKGIERWRRGRFAPTSYDRDRSSRSGDCRRGVLCLHLQFEAPALFEAVDLGLEFFGPALRQSSTGTFRWRAPLASTGKRMAAGFLCSDVSMGCANLRTI